MAAYDPSYIPKTPDEWQTYYSKLIKRVTLPRTHEEASTAGTFNIRDLVLDVSKIVKKDQTFAYGDVLTLPPAGATLDFTSGGFLFLVGRIFTATTSTTNLTIKVSKNTTKFIFYSTSHQADKTLNVIFSKDGNQLGSYELKPDETNIGIMLTYREKAGGVGGGVAGMSKDLLTDLDDTIQSEGLLERLIQSQLRVAALTMFTYPKLSASILSFICRLTFQSDYAAATHMEASTILAQLLADQRLSGNPNVFSVPSVSMTVYEDAVAALLDSTSAYSAQYDRFIDKRDDAQARQEAVKVMAQQNKDAAAIQAQLLVQAKTNWEDSLSAAQAAETSAKNMEQDVLVLSKKFAEGVKAWQEQKKKEAIFKAITAVITFGVAVGSIVAGNPAGASAAPTAIKGLADLGKTLAEVAKAAKTLNDELRTVTTQLDHISAIVDNLDRSIEETKDNIGSISSGNYDAAKQAKKLSAPDPDGTNAIAEWDAWFVGIKESMKVAIDNNIAGTGDYLVGLERQAIYGKAQCLTKAATCKAGQEYARAMLQYRTTTNHQGRLDAWIDDIQDKEATYEEKAAVFFDQLLSVKTFAVIQFRNYTSAFKYFSLRSSVVVIDMEKDILQLKRDFATLKSELASYLSNYSSDPQPYSLSLTSDNLPLNQKTIALEDLKTGNQFSITFDSANRGPLTGLTRVRLNGMRVYLNGVKSRAAETTLKLRITTEGLYEDFSETASFTFATLALKRSFWYDLKGTTIGKILIDAVIPDGFHNAPTPFAQWTFTVTNPEDVDLSGLTSITFELNGTAYGL